MVTRCDGVNADAAVLWTRKLIRDALDFNAIGTIISEAVVVIVEPIIAIQATEAIIANINTSIEAIPLAILFKKAFLAIVMTIMSRKIRTAIAEFQTVLITLAPCIPRLVQIQR